MRRHEAERRRTKIGASMSRRAGLLAFYLVVSIAFCWPLFAAAPRARRQRLGSAPLLLRRGAQERRRVRARCRSGIPWYCAGNVMWQNPQIAILSPVYPLAMLMPLQLAMKLNIVLHYWIGFAGAHLLLTRAIGLTFTPLVVLLATIVDGRRRDGDSPDGGTQRVPAGVLPAAAALLLLARDRQRRVASGVRRRWRAGADGLQRRRAHPADGSRRDRQLCAVRVAASLARGVRSLFAAAFFAVGFALAAPKLLPVSLYVTGDTFWDTRNATEHPDRMTTEMLRHAYLDPYQNTGLSFELQRHKWHEYGNYIGPAGGAPDCDWHRRLVGGARSTRLRLRARACAHYAPVVRVVARRVQHAGAGVARARSAAVFELSNSQPLRDSVHRLWRDRRGLGGTGSCARAGH